MLIGQPHFGAEVPSMKYLAPFPGLSREKAWGLLRAHARNISFIFRIIRRKISDNDVIVHGESARKEYADTFVYTVQ